MKNYIHLPDINLIDIECSEAFCRGTFNNDLEIEPKYFGIFGSSTCIVGAGFMLNEPKAHTFKIYFTQAG